jgi:hypothetical protein
MQQCFETSVTTHPTIERHLPEDLNAQPHRRRNIKSHRLHIYFSIGLGNLKLSHISTKFAVAQVPDVLTLELDEAAYQLNLHAATNGISVANTEKQAKARKAYRHQNDRDFAKVMTLSTKDQ